MIICDVQAKVPTDIPASVLNTTAEVIDAQLGYVKQLGHYIKTSLKVCIAQSVCVCVHACVSGHKVTCVCVCSLYEVTLYSEGKCTPNSMYI